MVRLGPTTCGTGGSGSDLGVDAQAAENERLEKRLGELAVEEDALRHDECRLLTTHLEKRDREARLRDRRERATERRDAVERRLERVDVE